MLSIAFKYRKIIRTEKNLKKTSKPANAQIKTYQIIGRNYTVSPPRENIEQKVQITQNQIMYLVLTLELLCTGETMQCRNCRTCHWVKLF